MLQVAVPSAERPLLCGGCQALMDLMSLCVPLQKCQSHFMGKGQVLINNNDKHVLVIIIAVSQQLINELLQRVRASPFTRKAQEIVS